MSKKFGLGKGLNALIPEDTILDTSDCKRSQYVLYAANARPPVANKRKHL